MFFDDALLYFIANHLIRQALRRFLLTEMHLKEVFVRPAEEHRSSSSYDGLRADFRLVLSRERKARALPERRRDMFACVVPVLHCHIDVSAGAQQCLVHGTQLCMSCMLLDCFVYSRHTTTAATAATASSVVRRSTLFAPTPLLSSSSSSSSSAVAQVQNSAKDDAGDAPASASELLANQTDITDDVLLQLRREWALTGSAVRPQWPDYCTP